MDPTQVKRYEEDLQRLEVALRELKVKYDQFFAGALDRQPIELRRQVERIIEQFNRQQPGKLALRFHFNSLLARYNSFSELWGKTLRSMEEGEHRHVSDAEKFGIRERLIGRALIADATAEEQELRRLHGRFVDARMRLGKRAVPFEKFARSIAQQTEQLRRKHECGQIEVRLVETGEGVQIKARPRGSRSGSTGE